MNNKHLVILVVSLGISTFHSIAQSVEINPTNPTGFISSVGGLNSSIENLSKIGTSRLRIEGLLKNENENLFYTHGSANIELVGNPNGNDFNGIVSNQKIKTFIKSSFRLHTI